MFKNEHAFSDKHFFQFQFIYFCQGLPFENGRFTSVDELAAFLTSLIFTSSVVHATVNFPQYDTYGYFPNYPPMLIGTPPKHKVYNIDNPMFTIIY